MMKKVIILVMTLTLILGISGCNKINETFNDTYEEGDIEVFIDIEYESNIILAKDDLDIYIDNHKFYAIGNGEDKTYTFNLTPGEHTVKIAEGENHIASEEINVEKDGDAFIFTVKNHMNKVELSLKDNYNYYEKVEEAESKMDNLMDKLEEDEE